ncbi:glycoside hydrolase family 47 protein [Mycena metata]|uniref:alpha-1,2-Mannosidase n=1 Tax=Mycena metata TaxID=1033252 RepID=A0AAD7HGC3_9AGAR|nr:glycoside hydrolase family 47 protein [Mycena metata]
MDLDHRPSDYGSKKDTKGEKIAGGRYVKPSRPSRPKDPPPNDGSPAPSRSESRPNTLPADVRKRDAVVDAFKHAWSAYERDAMGSDEYHPISHRGSNLSYSGGIGYTVVDALDTMLLMGLDAEYERAKKWVAQELSFDHSGYFSTFETTIRVLGGLLSAHYLTGDKLYLQHAADLGDRMLGVFDTPSGLPVGSVNLGGRSHSGGGSFSVAEATTLQLEFRYLAEVTGRTAFWHKAEKVMQVVNKARLPSGLAPIDMDGKGEFVRSRIGMGSNGDSYYEYLLKQYIQTNRTEPVYLQMYTDAMQGVHDYMVWKTPTEHLTYIAELQPLPGKDDWKATDAWVSQPKQEHLACFLAGSLMLGATTAHLRDPATAASRPPHMSELSATGQRDWETGVAFLEACMDTQKTATGLSPEGVHFRTPADPKGEHDWYIKGSKESTTPPYDARYMLRPEISESVFLAYRLTGDPRYRTYAWDIFSAIERHCRLPEGGYATVLDVDELPVRYLDKQETFFLSETLKYLFLTFADEKVLNLNEVVFNTEAHPLPIFKPSIQPLFTKYSS